MAEEQAHLRATFFHPPAGCYIVARVADKFGHARLGKVTYSVPVRHACRALSVRRYRGRVPIAVGPEVAAEPRQAFLPNGKVRDALRVRLLLERKPRAVAEAAARLCWGLAPVWQ